MLSLSAHVARPCCHSGGGGGAKKDNDSDSDDDDADKKKLEGQLAGEIMAFFVAHFVYRGVTLFGRCHCQ